MKKPRKKIIKQRILKWLMNATLVFTLFAFSGHVPESRFNNFEPVKTELTHSVKTNFKRIARFKKTPSSLLTLYKRSFKQKAIFTSRQSLYEQQLTLQLKNNFLNYCTDQGTQATTHYSTGYSQESDAHNSRR